jgi:hypothetical protein
MASTGVDGTKLPFAHWIADAGLFSIDFPLAIGSLKRIE